MEQVSAPKDVIYEADTIGGVSGLWCKPKEVRPGQAFCISTVAGSTEVPLRPSAIWSGTLCFKPVRLRSSQTTGLIRNDQFPFHLRQARYGVKEEAAKRHAGVDGVSQALNGNSLLLKLSAKIDQVLDAAAEPVQFLDNQGVSRAKTFTGLSQTGTFGPASAHPIFEDLLATGFL